MPSRAIASRGPLSARSFTAEVMLQSQATHVRRVTSPQTTPATISEATEATVAGHLGTGWQRTTRCLAFTRAEQCNLGATLAAPAPTAAIEASQVTASTNNPACSERRATVTTAQQSRCTRKRLRLVSYSTLFVVVLLVFHGYEEFVHQGAQRGSLWNVWKRYSPAGVTTTRHSEGCKEPEASGRQGRDEAWMISTRSVVLPAGWYKGVTVNSVRFAAVKTVVPELLLIAATPIVSLILPVAVGTLCRVVGSARTLLVCMRIILTAAAEAADVPLPAGRAVIGRSKGVGAGGAAAQLGVGGTERAAAGPNAAAPAVNEAAGAGGWREKRGDGAKSEGHNGVIPRGVGAATAAALAVAMTSVTTQEEGFAKDSYWARSLRRRWGEQAYLDMVARTINGLESERFWLTMLGKQLQLQSSKTHLKTQRIERHKLEQRRKKQAMAAFNQAQGKAEAAAAEYQRQQRRAGGAGPGGAAVPGLYRQAGPGAGPGPRVITLGEKNEAELRFGELSLYTLDWVGPRTCAQLGWAAGNDVCALSLEIEIHVLHSRLLLKSVEVQDRQNRLFVCDSGAAFFRASAAALAKQEGPERQLFNKPVSRNSKKCRGCDRGKGSPAGSTTSTTVRGRDQTTEKKGGTARSPHTATTGTASIGAVQDAPLEFWDDQGGYGDDWTHRGGSRIGATGAPGMGVTQERGTTVIGADKRRGNRPPAGAGAGGAPPTGSSPSPARPQAAAMVKAGKKGQQQPHHGGGADGDLKHQHHHAFSSVKEDGSAANGDRGAGGATKKRRRPNKRRKKIDSYNRNVAASLGTLQDVFDWEAIAHSFYIPALADLQPPSKSTVESFTTELTYLMGVLDREESLRSGKPTVNVSSLSHDHHLRSPYVYSPVPLAGQPLGPERPGADRYGGINFFPDGGGGQVRRPSPFDGKRPGPGNIAWAVESWPRGKGASSVQPTHAAAAAPGGTFQGITVGNRPQAPNVPSYPPPLGRMPDASTKRRPAGPHTEKPDEKKREKAEKGKDKKLFPLVHVRSPSRPLQRLSAPSVHGANHAGEEQQEQQQQTYPWRPVVTRSTRPQQFITRPEQSKLNPAPVLARQAPAEQQDDLAEKRAGPHPRRTYPTMREENQR